MEVEVSRIFVCWIPLKSTTLDIDQILAEVPDVGPAPVAPGQYKVSYTSRLPDEVIKMGFLAKGWYGAVIKFIRPDGGLQTCLEAQFELS